MSSNKVAYAVTIPPTGDCTYFHDTVVTLQQVQGIVGGYLEEIPTPLDGGFYVNEEGIYSTSEVNHDASALALRLNGINPDDASPDFQLVGTAYFETQNIAEGWRIRDYLQARGRTLTPAK